MTSNGASWIYCTNTVAFALSLSVHQTRESSVVKYAEGNKIGSNTNSNKSLDFNETHKLRSLQLTDEHLITE